MALPSLLRSFTAARVASVILVVLAGPQAGNVQGRRLASMRHCSTKDLPHLPVPGLQLLESYLPQPDEVRQRLIGVEGELRRLPMWQNLTQEDILPTASAAPDDETLKKRYADAVLLGVAIIGAAIFVSELLVFLTNTLPLMLRPPTPKSYKPLLEEGLEEGAGGSTQVEEELELELGPGKTVVFIVYYIGHNACLLALASWAKSHNLLLGSAGIDWEVIGAWLLALMVTDILTFTARSIQATCLGLKMPHPAVPMALSVIPVLGPRVDLFKDVLFSAAVFQLAACSEDPSTSSKGYVIGVLALLSLFLPAPFLLWKGTTRRDLAVEFLPALGARLKAPPAEGHPSQERQVSEASEVTTWESWWQQKVVSTLVSQCTEARLRLAQCMEVTTWESWYLWGQEKAKDQVVSTLVSQCTEARLRTAVAEDLFQAVLALAAMINFDQYSGMLLLNFVVSGAKIGIIPFLRYVLLSTGYYAQGDGVALITFAATVGLEAQDENSQTPLHLAARDGRKDAMEVLLKAGANKEAEDYNGQTPLHRAAENGHKDAVEALLKAGASKEAKDKDGSTPLHYAADSGHKDAVEALLKAGASKEAEDIRGWTPLQRAARNGHKDAVEALLKAGANKDATDKHGKTPLDLARKSEFDGPGKDYPKCIELLERR